MTFALLFLAALALPAVAHATAAADCAAALQIALPGAHVTAASAVPASDSLRALGQKPYCSVEATIDEETHIAALLPDDWNGPLHDGWRRRLRGHPAEPDGVERA
jgi:hypothetical protein